MSGPGPYGPGPRSEPHEVPVSRRDMPYGPDISWPNGFRQLDIGARRMLEPGYGRGRYDRVDPGYRQPDPSGFMDDYGDPGYSDPSYDGPRSGSGGRGWQGGNSRSGYGAVAGYHVPDYREPALGAGYQQGYADSRSYPVTGEQEALPAYPEQWYGHPRLDDPRDSGARPGSPPAGDPRLEGMRYDELRYDEPSGYDEPLDDDSWVEELRRSAPQYPPPPAGRPGGNPRGPGYGQQLGWGSQPGLGQPGGYPQGSGYGQDQGGSGPAPSRGPRMSADLGTRPRNSAPQDPAIRGDAYLGAPAMQVGVLTRPATTRLEDPPGSGPQTATLQPVAPSVAPDAGRVAAPPVRPGHGLDGPEITSSWPSQPQADELAFEEFWAEDDNDADYPGLFPGNDPDSDPRHEGGPGKVTGRRTGRRRGRSNDHRLWLALLGVLVMAAAAIFGILKFEFPSHSGPGHVMGTPPRIGSYVRTVDMERETKVNQLRDEVIRMSSGQASGVVSAVYESGNSAAGSTEQIVMFIGGHLANAAPASSIASFTQKFAGAEVVSAGSLGGKAACVEEAPGASDSVAMCVWFDNDSFGEIVSPTMNATSLASVMRSTRPSLETVVKK